MGVVDCPGAIDHCWACASQSASICWPRSGGGGTGRQDQHECGNRESWVLHGEFSLVAVTRRAVLQGFPWGLPRSAKPRCRGAGRESRSISPTAPAAKPPHHQAQYVRADSGAASFKVISCVNCNHGRTCQNAVVADVRIPHRQRDLADQGLSGIFRAGWQLHTDPELAATRSLVTFGLIPAAPVGLPRGGIDRELGGLRFALHPGRDARRAGPITLDAGNRTWQRKACRVARPDHGRIPIRVQGQPDGHCINSGRASASRAATASPKASRPYRPDRAHPNPFRAGEEEPLLPAEACGPAGRRPRAGPCGGWPPGRDWDCSGPPPSRGRRSRPLPPSPCVRARSA